MTEPTSRDLVTVDNQYSDRDYTVKISIPEFNCVCPQTGLPDFATITVTYIPDKKIVELKSLKLYIVKYRNLGIFHEHVTNRIMDDLVTALNPKEIDVQGDFRPRGGIHTVISASWRREK
ncbi:MAG: NADPH-dependent 7-cyano-7-deazaguanine reductase QueF [FCB group bacterium]|nr:NADPH-dependent 7-cyano-7-deazaguanine reductase QueF [FCB group bacterium]